MDPFKRNLYLGITHESLWGAAFGLVNPFTMLPLAAHALGRSVSDAGLMEAALFFGINIVQLPAAFWIGNRFSDPVPCALMHIPSLSGTLLGLLALVLPGLDPGMRWALFLGGFILHWVGMGLVVPSWATLSSRNIPDKWLGRYFGWCFAASGLLASLTGSLAARWADQGGLAWGYAACVGTALGLQVLSVSVLAMTRPMVKVPARSGTLGSYVRAQGRRLLTKPALKAFILLSIVWQFAGASTQLFTSSLKDAGLLDIAFTWLNPALALGGMAGAFALGWMLDRKGAVPAWRWSLGALGLSLLLVGFNAHLPGLVLGYAASGFFGASFGVVNLPWVLKQAGTKDTAAFMGLVNTVVAPFCFLAPACLGILARSQGSRLVYAISGLAAALALAFTWSGSFAKGRRA